MSRACQYIGLALCNYLPRSEVSGEEVIVVLLTEESQDDSLHSPCRLQSSHPPSVRPQPLQLGTAHTVLQAIQFNPVRPTTFFCI